jgi:uncharacterized protein YdhG (YjbR/CyaY superfamily)
MKTEPTKLETIDHYIAGFPHDVRERLEKIRQIIQKAAPDAEAAIKYQIPTFVLEGNLISFAAYKNHIGLYPTPKGNEKFQKELATYKSEKYTAKFPHDKPLPLELIRDIVKFRLEEHLEKVVAKRKKK